MIKQIGPVHLHGCIWKVCARIFIIITIIIIIYIIVVTIIIIIRSNQIDLLGYRFFSK